MRTTLNLDDALVRAAKQRALDDDTTLTAVIERALASFRSDVRALAREEAEEEIVLETECEPEPDGGEVTVEVAP